MGKEHAYLLCKHENGLALLDYIAKHKLSASEWDTPPESSSPQLFAGESLKVVLRKLARLFFSMHGYCRKTIRGNFTLNNVWVTDQGDVKLHGIQLIEATDARIMSVYKKLAKQLRKEQFNLEIPIEIEQWFVVMESDDPSLEELIVVFPGIMAERNQLELFMRIVENLSPIKSRNRLLYDEIVENLPYAEDWEFLVQANSHLSEIYCHVDKYGNFTVYEIGIPGLNQFLKNCDSHLYEKAIKTGHQLPSFSSWHLPRMILGTVPLYLGALAEKLYRYGELLGLRPHELTG